MMNNKAFLVILIGIILIAGVFSALFFSRKYKNNRVDFHSDKPWITIAPNKRYFMFEDGKSFFPIGTAMAGEQAQTDYFGHIYYKENKFPFYEVDLTMDPNGLEKHFIDMKNNGENVLRIDTDGWTFSRKEGFVQYLIDSGKARFLENPVGVFDEEYAKRIDNLMVLAEKYGIYIDLVFSPDTVQWARFEQKHPYYKNNGGFMEEQSDIFTTRQGREVYKNRIKFIVDRWGASPNIFVWELFNEMNWWGGENSFQEEKADWVNEMGKFLRDYEKSKYGKNHLIITSTSSYDGPDDYFFNSPQIDVAVTHYYFGENRLPDPFVNVKRIKEITEDILKNRLSYDKPFWENERSAGRCDISLDIELAISLAEIASGAAGSGLMWAHSEKYLPESKTDYDLNGEYRIDYFQKNNTSMRYNIVSSVNKLVNKIISNSGIDWARFNSININNDVSVNDNTIEVMAAGDGKTVFGFLIKNQKQDYLIDFIGNALDYPDGCGGSLTLVFGGVKNFIGFYKKNGVEVNLSPLLEKLSKDSSIRYGIDEKRIRELIQNAYSDPDIVKRNETSIPRDLFFTAGKDVSDYLKSLEKEHKILSKNYRSYLESWASLSIKGLSAGGHEIKWVDPLSGNVISSQKFNGDSVSVKTPNFGKFLVFIIKS